MGEYLQSFDSEMNYIDSFEASHQSEYFSLSEFNSIMNDNKHCLSLIDYNIRSLQRNSLNFLPIIEENLPSFVILTETWFNNNNNGANIDNYHAFHVIRTNRRSGGVSVFIRNIFECRKIDQFCFVNSNIEICTVEVIVSSKKIFLLSIYRPHEGTIQAFSEELENILANDIFINSRCYLSGDFNIHMDRSDEDTDKFIECMRSYHYLPLITKPTRFPANDQSQPTLLDMIWTNSIEITSAGIIDYDLTDHCPTFIQFPTSHIDYNDDSSLKIRIVFRDISESNRLEFSRKLSTIDWSLIYSENLNANCENFITILNNLYCDTFPLKSKLVSRNHVMNPWFTPELKELINHKSTYFQLLRIGAITKAENNFFKNRVKFIIRKTKSDYYMNLFNQNLNNMRNTWKTLNHLMDRKTKESKCTSLMSNDILYSNDSDIAEIFSDYFAKIPVELENNLPKNNIDPTSLIPNVPHRLSHFELCIPSEVSDIIMNLKLTKQNRDSVSIRLIKDNVDTIAPVVSDLINQSLVEGVFPDCLKLAEIIPIFKKGETNLPSNYRPISLLPYLSKIYEKIIYFRLILYFNEHSLLSPNQFGFRQNLSTQDAIIEFTENIYNSLNEKHSSMNIFIDYSKAFDTVDHKILLRKLDKYGINGSAHRLLASFLKDRKQVVRFKNAFSTEKHMRLGVPQGSCLGPFLFLVHINDFPLLSNSFETTLFADDCVVQFHGSDITTLTTECNLELGKIAAWTQSNRLTVNVSKTNLMLISNVVTDIPEDIIFDDHILNIVSESKFLGVIIDNKLKYDKHIQSIRIGISKLIGIMRRLSYVVPLTSLKNIYLTLINPLILYCLQIFAATYEIHLTPLRTLQNRAIRIISGKAKEFHINLNPLYYQNNILKIEDQYKLGLACYIFKNREILDRFVVSHQYDTRNRNLPVAPRERLRSTEQSVIFNAVKIWRELPQDLKDSRSINSFKFRYKRIFVDQYNI